MLSHPIFTAIIGAIVGSLLSFVLTHLFIARKSRGKQDEFIEMNNLYIKLINNGMADISLIDHRIGLLKSLESNGIEDIINGWGQADEYIKLKIEKASSIKIIYTAGNTFFNLNMDSFKIALSNRAEIKAILATKNSVYVQETIEMEKKEHPENNIPANITHTEGLLEQWKKNYPLARITIKHFNTQFRANIMIIDDVAYYTPLLPPKQSRQLLTYKLKKGKLFEACYNHFERMFELLP